MKRQTPTDRLVKIYETPTITEAIVVRGLLKNAGIYAPDFDTGDPFPLHDPPEGWHSSEIWVPDSQAEEARRIIAESRKNRRKTRARRIGIRKVREADHA